ncbi:MAG: hypothetical protein M1838_005566 [Thelocarpon superellum]|nr:MAG: hypothetical protein M1838_005566 [Thelocarpon superellum]
MSPREVTISSREISAASKMSWYSADSDSPEQPTSSKGSFRRRRMSGSKKHKGSPERATKTAPAAVRRGSLTISGPFSVPKDPDEEFPLRNSTAVFSITEAPQAEEDEAERGIDPPATAEIGRAFTTTGTEEPMPTLPARAIKTKKARIASFNEVGLLDHHDDGKDAPAYNLDPPKLVARHPSTASEKTRRKGNPVKVALQRLFSRRGTRREVRKDLLTTPPVISRPLGQAGRAPEHHRSDPGFLAAMLDDSLPRNTPTPSSRAASAPFGEITKSTPLGSNTPNGTDLQFSREFQLSHQRRSTPSAPRPRDHEHGAPRVESREAFLHDETQGPTRARRASLPGADAVAIERPPSRQDTRGAEPDQAMNSDDEGVASGTSRARRRSRSANDLRAFDEAGRWKSATDKETNQKAKEARPRSSETSAASSSRSKRRDHPIQETHVSTFTPFKGVLGLGETESAEPKGLDARVGTLEQRTSKLETVVVELQSAPRLTCTGSNEFILQDAPKRRSFRERRSISPKNKVGPPSPVHSQASGTLSHGRSFERSSQYNNVPITPREDTAEPRDQTPPPPGPTPSQTPTRSHGARAAGPPTLAMEHYTALLALLKHEQAARKKLERHVSSLQRELHHLRTPTTVTPKTSNPYPTPSPESEERISKIQRVPRFAVGLTGPHPTVPESNSSDSVVDEDSCAASDSCETPTEILDRHLFAGRDIDWESQEEREGWMPILDQD